MTHDDEREVGGRLEASYRETPPLDRAARGRLLAQLRDAAPPRRGAGPIVAGLRLAVAAALVVAGVLTVRAIRAPTGPDAGDPAPAAGSVVRFELDAPAAARVALVGDFNDWDQAATPMRRARTGDRWSVSIPVPPGRHLYGFVVDGGRWVGDPSAPRAPEDGFGSTNSVIVVAESGIAS